MVNAALRFLVAGVRTASLGNHAADYSRGVLLIPVVQRVQTVYLLGGFDVAFRVNAGSENTRDVLSAFKVARGFQRVYRVGDAGFDFVLLVIPACDPRKLQRRVRECHAVSRTLLDRFPDLVYLLDGQLALIEHHEMSVQILVLEQHIAFRLQVLVAPRSARFLNIVLQRRRNIEMHDKPDVGFIHAHAESRGRHDNVDPAAHELLLIRDFLALVHLSVERERLYSVRVQPFRNAESPLDL